MITDSAICLTASPQNDEAADRCAKRQRRHAQLGSCGHILLIGKKEFGDRLRSGWVVACILVWMGAIGLTSFLGLLQIGQIGIQGYERTVISLLNLVQYL